MIIDKDINPKKNIYYLGAILIDIISKQDCIGSFDLFEQMRLIENISYSMFCLCLDWLFLLNIIEIKAGMVEKCF